MSVIFAGRSGTDTKLDLEDEASIRSAVQEIQPDVIINAAAYTQVDDAEDEPERAMQINGHAPGILAEEANKCGAKLIQVSTDFVFDGTRDRPYEPMDETNPINSYGASKLKGEEAVSNMANEFIIVRLAWVFSTFGQNFYKTMLRLGKDRDEIHVVDDQVGNPTSAYEIAEGLLNICKQLGNGDKRLLGTIQHLVGLREMTRFEFAQKIFASNKIECVVKPTTTGEMKMKAKRPANSRLLPTIEVPNRPLFHHELER